MNLEQYKQNLFNKETNITNRRQELVKELLDLINIERVGTKYRPITARAVAIKVSHLSETDLTWLISTGKDYKNRHGSFSKYFFGVLKAKNNPFNSCA